MRHLLKIAFLLIFTIVISSCNHNPVTPTIESIEYEHILEDYFIESIAFDHEGTAWIGTLHQGLVRYDKDVFHYNSSNSILPDSFMVLAIEVDSIDNVWIGSSIGLIKHNDNKFVIFDKLNSPVYYNIYSLALDNDNSIWFTNGNIYQGGVIQYTGIDWNFYTPDNSELPSTIINDISVDKKNNKWFTCYGAVVKYSNSNWTIFKQ